MKKQLLIIGILTLLITVGLSGCQETPIDIKPPVTGDVDKVDLLTYTIETYGTNNLYSQGTKLGDGFIHNSTYNFTYYLIQGTIKNIDHHVLFNVSVTVNFYDENKSYLANAIDYIAIIRRNTTQDFRVYYSNEQPFFENITQVIFHIVAP